MRENKKRTIKSVIGLILMIISISCIYYWESYGKEKFYYEEIIVLKKDIPKYTVINKEQFKLIRLPQNILPKDVLSSYEGIVNLEAKRDIKAGMPLTIHDFIESDRQLHEDEFIFSIPRNWLMVIPNSVRRYDRVYLYPFKILEDKEIDLSTKKEEDIESQIEVQSLTSICSLKVAYVKDNANQEVEDVTEVKRLNGTANISDIEVVCNLDQFKCMENYIQEGYKFIMFYK